MLNASASATALAANDNLQWLEVLRDDNGVKMSHDAPLWKNFPCELHFHLKFLGQHQISRRWDRQIGGLLIMI
jgi:hypothetical protein